MQKIISLFCRNYDGDRLVRNEIVPGAEWVIAGEGIATRKLDGTCCLIRDGKLYKRYEVKPGKKPPVNFEPATDVDLNTGKIQGWLPVGDGPEDQWHREAFQDRRGFCEANNEPFCDGTYELVGPKVGGGGHDGTNPEGFHGGHCLIPHKENPYLLLEPDPPRDFDGIREYLRARDIEGIVWHHPDGRMVKIKKKDFGLKRKPLC